MATNLYFFSPQSTERIDPTNSEQEASEAAPANGQAGALGSHGQVQQADASGSTAWQRAVLPTMQIILFSVTIFFFAATFFQIRFLHESILDSANGPTLILPASRADIQLAANYAEQMQARNDETTLALEAYALQRRYRQADVLLMTSVWIRYLGFATGMILAVVGASFILGKLRETPTNISAETSSFKGTIASSSPGLIMVVLGVVLMATTLVRQHSISVRDRPVYLDAITIEDYTEQDGSDEQETFLDSGELPAEEPVFETASESVTEPITEGN